MSKSKQPKPEEADGKTAAEDKSAAPGAPETAKDAAPETEAPETDTPEAVTPETGAAKTDTPETDEAERLSAEDTLAAGEPETRADPAETSGSETAEALSAEDTLAAGASDTVTATDELADQDGDLAPGDDSLATGSGDDSLSDAGDSDGPDRDRPESDIPDSDRPETVDPMQAGLVAEDTGAAQTPPQGPGAGETVIERRGGFVPMLLGGIVAAGLGYGVAWYQGQDDSFETETRAALEEQSGRLDAVSEQITTMASDSTQRIDTLAADLTATQEALGLAEGALGAQEERLTGVEALRDEIAALDERLTTLAKRPIADTVSREAIAAYESELERLRGSMAEQRQAIEDTIAAEKAKIEQIAAEATQMEERALEEARISSARTALTQVLTALETGEAYAEPRWRCWPRMSRRRWPRCRPPRRTGW